jgi:hypothetical protein
MQFKKNNDKTRATFIAEITDSDLILNRILCQRGIDRGFEDRFRRRTFLRAIEYISINAIADLRFSSHHG